ncbi:MAG: hypothetical protein HYT67_01110 [Candidatus Yanofskybacteria bacterium]|nr:hypothetical protein [Candidatus Yanofskybacteria bacterium]
MFRGIGGAIEKKVKGFAKNNEASDKLNRAFARFLAGYFPEGRNSGFKVDFLNNKVTIQTSNKTVANELILRIRDLTTVLKEENLNFDQIIIR